MNKNERCISCRFYDPDHSQKIAGEDLLLKKWCKRERTKLGTIQIEFIANLDHQNPWEDMNPEKTSCSCWEPFPRHILGWKKRTKEKEENEAR